LRCIGLPPAQLPEEEELPSASRYHLTRVQQVRATGCGSPLRLFPAPRRDRRVVAGEQDFGQEAQDREQPADQGEEEMSEQEGEQSMDEPSEQGEEQDEPELGEEAGEQELEQALEQATEEPRRDEGEGGEEPDQEQSGQLPDEDDQAGAEDEPQEGDKEGERDKEESSEKGELESPDSEEGKGEKDQEQTGDAGEEKDKPGDREASEAVDRVDQMDQASLEPEDDRQAPGFTEETTKGQGGATIPDYIAEQWLERVESDPRRLMRSQFQMEEREEWKRQRGRFVEPRPW